MTKIAVITYLIYIIFWGLLTLGGSGYVVFVLNRDPGWILLGVTLCSLCFSPKSWKELFDK